MHPTFLENNQYYQRQKALKAKQDYEEKTNTKTDKIIQKQVRTN